ncbi:hypothetical protein AN218_07595 [Streptomyces nanshensis]|uniref:Uncharacterized protein n=2 Tax=Streptomyces nanshensis TaxID=518642 RepID=A0A1E7L8V9_9ACTN|nr:hypothetical protein AN218_07595 [Streptomyces nanshensis]
MRFMRYAIHGVAELPSACEADAPPMRAGELHVTYVSHDGSPWKLDTALLKGRYAANAEMPRFSGRTACPVMIHPFRPDYASSAWVLALIEAVRTPAVAVADPAEGVELSLVQDQGIRTRHVAVAAAAGTVHPEVVPPLRPERAKLTYRSDDGSPWELESVDFRGLYAAIGPEPGPGQRQGRAPVHALCASAVATAPLWVRDFITEHSTPPPLADPPPH